jgi:hypothetical protein
VPIINTIRDGETTKENSAENREENSSKINIESHSENDKTNTEHEEEHSSASSDLDADLSDLEADPAAPIVGNPILSPVLARGPSTWDPPGSATNQGLARADCAHASPATSARAGTRTSTPVHGHAHDSPPRSSAPESFAAEDAPGFSAFKDFAGGSDDTDDYPPPQSAVSLRPRIRLQQGIKQPKKYTDGTIRYVMLSFTGEPCTLTEALGDSNWRKAMDEEYNALIRNKTWHLVPTSANKNVIDCK